MFASLRIENSVYPEFASSIGKIMIRLPISWVMSYDDIYQRPSHILHDPALDSHHDLEKKAPAESLPDPPYKFGW